MSAKPEEALAEEKPMQGKWPEPPNLSDEEFRQLQERREPDREESYYRN